MKTVIISLSAGLFMSLFFLTAFKSSPKGPREGDIAPEIRLPNPTGDTLRLSSLKGHMVLVHFWASWCAPCRAESKKIVKIYDAFKDKEYKTGTGLIVLYVSLDQDKNDWLKAIKQDGLSLQYNVSDLKRWQNIAAQSYKVTSVPNNFLIDGNGKIIEQGQITDYLADILKGEIQK